ncbi:MAG: hypothetical protein ACI9G1_005499, partial [Pirellulaceae bacterium]
MPTFFPLRDVVNIANGLQIETTFSEYDRNLARSVGFEIGEPNSG